MITSWRKCKQFASLLCFWPLYNSNNKQKEQLQLITVFMAILVFAAANTPLHVRPDTSQQRVSNKTTRQRSAITIKTDPRAQTTFLSEAQAPGLSINKWMEAHKHGRKASKLLQMRPRLIRILGKVHIKVPIIGPFGPWWQRVAKTSFATYNNVCI